MESTVNERIGIIISKLGYKSKRAFAKSGTLFYLVIQVFAGNITARLAQFFALFVIYFMYQVIPQYGRNSAISFLFTHGFRF